jgi:hypothetical protein
MKYSNAAVHWAVGMERTTVMPVIKMSVGDTLELKKPHPCGEKHFRVMRVGSEVRVVCIGCGRDMVLDRVKLERAIRKLIPAEEPPDSH